MLFRLASLAVILGSAFTAEAADGSYNYDETHIWDQVITGGKNECAGSKNSPIAVEDEGCTDYHTYVKDDGTCTFADMKPTVTNNGVKLGFKSDADCTAPSFILPGTEDRYTFAQLHIHLSSEHTINGEYYAAELHMVHVGPNNGRFSVIGTMIQPDNPLENKNFGPYIDSWKDARYAMESKCSEKTCKINNGYATDKNLLYAETINMHPYKLLETGKFFTYFGGLTTPPCTQAVYWNLASEPMNIGVRQFAELAEIILKTMDPATDCKKKLTVASVTGSTSRPPQPLNGRVVKKVCPTTPGKSDNTTGSGTVAAGSNTGEEDSSAEISAYTVGAMSIAAVTAAAQLL